MYIRLCTVYTVLALCIHGNEANNPNKQNKSPCIRECIFHSVNATNNQSTILKVQYDVFGYICHQCSNRRKILISRNDRGKFFSNICKQHSCNGELLANLTACIHPKYLSKKNFITRNCKGISEKNPATKIPLWIVCFQQNVLLTKKQRILKIYPQHRFVGIFIRSLLLKLSLKWK